MIVRKPALLAAFHAQFDTGVTEIDPEVAAAPTIIVPTLSATGHNFDSVISFSEHATAAIATAAERREVSQR